jgi:hypothetical protein
MLQRLALSNLGMTIGLILTSIGLWAYVTNQYTLNLAGFFYGIPLLLIGMALKSSELKPIPFTQPTSPAVLTLREQQATVTQTKLRKDVMRYRYGENVHLEIALKKLGLIPNSESRPVLDGLREEQRQGAYTLVLEFASSKVPLATWQDKQEQMIRFFGPDIQIDLVELKEDRIELALIRQIQASSEAQEAAA